MKGRVHVVGAGLAGLNAAVRLAGQGWEVRVHEAAPQAGGRCRSFFDAGLDAVIDNGAHLMLSGNTEVAAYLRHIHAEHEVFAAERARFDFCDIATGRQWAVDLGKGGGMLSLASWLALPGRRPPGVGAVALLADMHALKRGNGRTVAACVGHSSAFTVFWRPLTLAVLNAEPGQAAAQLLWSVLRETALKGGAFARPLFFRSSLGGALVEPALAELGRLGVEVRLGARVRALACDGGRAVSLATSRGGELLGPGDKVVLAVPHFAAGEIIPELRLALASRAILNVHYRLPEGVSAPPPMTGLLNAAAHWVLVRGRVASVTVSAADAWMDKEADDIAQMLWRDVAKAFGIEGAAPAYRVIKERRATFAQTPDAIALRPATRTAYANVFLAGDWVDTGLPATIEGALKSGRLAAQAVEEAR